jgi:GNAT superfamily N-acetyltransferase
VFRPRERVIALLVSEWEALHDPTFETLSVLVEGDRVAVEFRIYAMEGGRIVELNRAAFLTIAGNHVQTADLYYAEPQPSARRTPWKASATLTEAELEQLFDSLYYTFDVRTWLPPIIARRMNLRELTGGTGDPHPSGSFIGEVHWSAEETDAKIAAIIEDHRRRNAGFMWQVRSSSTPADLCERLERHGLVLAGDEAVMARVGLDDLDDIPTNPDLAIEILDGSDDAMIEESIQIAAITFHWTQQQVDVNRVQFRDRIKNPDIRKDEHCYLASLNGTPIAEASITLLPGVALLSGASTLPEYRGRRVYSTLLKRRLEDARARGYQMAVIYAQPMSRRVVSRYGFKEYGTTYIYAWMPEIDMDVIRSLVVNE